MRLSDIKGERTFDVVAALVEPVANIAADENAVRLFKREKCPKGQTPREFMLGKIRASVPALMTEHKRDLAVILATLKGVAPEEYVEGLDMMALLGDVVELVTDEDFSVFLS